MERSPGVDSWTGILSGMKSDFKFLLSLLGQDFRVIFSTYDWPQGNDEVEWNQILEKNRIYYTVPSMRPNIVTTAIVNIISSNTTL